jgi:hypothetical protein
MLILRPKTVTTSITEPFRCYLLTTFQPQKYVDCRIEIRGKVIRSGERVRIWELEVCTS